MILFFTTILVLPLMLIFSGLAIDLAALGTFDDRIQVAADAAATAGAASIHFVKDDPECLVNCPGSWVMNHDVPSAYAALNGFPSPSIVFNPGTPSVTVTLTSSMSTSFLRVLGITQLQVGAVAAAVRINVTQADKDAEPPVPGRSALTQ